ncbi:MAG: hypothetical protein F6K03_03085 [Kamptonema sp. SIO4C4]|nr:hypothetical protein [Kamptonema sp. SIO4C4]
MKLVLKRSPLPHRPATAPGEIVLRQWDSTTWTTHFHNLQDSGYYHGSYFSERGEAEKDYEHKIQRYSIYPM